jgi:hypothetical protein
METSKFKTKPSYSPRLFTHSQYGIIILLYTSDYILTYFPLACHSRVVRCTSATIFIPIICAYPTIQTWRRTAWFGYNRGRKHSFYILSFSLQTVHGNLCHECTVKFVIYIVTEVLMFFNIFISNTKEVKESFGSPISILMFRTLK